MPSALHRELSTYLRRAGALDIPPSWPANPRPANRDGSANEVDRVSGRTMGLPTNLHVNRRAHVSGEWRDNSHPRHGKVNKR